MSIKLSKPLLMIGGRVDGDLMSVPEGAEGHVKVPVSIDDNPVLNFGFDDIEQPLPYEMYVHHYIHGVELLAHESMTSTDVMHALMKSYRKR